MFCTGTLAGWFKMRVLPPNHCSSVLALWNHLVHQKLHTTSWEHGEACPASPIQLAVRCVPGVAWDRLMWVTKCMDVRALRRILLVLCMLL